MATNFASAFRSAGSAVFCGIDAMRGRDVHLARSGAAHISGAHSDAVSHFLCRNAGVQHVQGKT